ncbi:DUF421 domain-containing protein [Roseovarius sp. D0-M9]|uniref:DUF421 domain-containing protein n=1 Tax=Roseovarius sp. D0-M9 TaxID=3127117 RepID=UPI003010258C
MFGTETSGVIQPIVGIALSYLAVILFSRIAGLRSFTMLSGYDFAATIAIGSLLASAAIGALPLWSGLAAIAGLLAVQATVSLARRQSWGHALVDNKPLLLMDGTEVLRENLSRAGLIEDDLASQLRAAGATSGEDVRAVILETSGDVSVILGEGGFDRLDPLIARGVRR